jgi:hypothetical protein
MTKFRCGSIIPSSCVPFSGKDLSFLTTANQIACDASIDDVIEKVSDKLVEIGNAIDVSDYDTSCLQGLPAYPTLVQISKAHTEAICAISSQVETLIDEFAELDIANEHITINLGCLAPAATSCAVATNTYTLISILTLLKNEICAIKTELGI